MNKEELLYNEIYERTKDFGRTQFVREIMRLQRENKELQQKVNQLELDVDSYKNKYERANELYLDTSKKLNQLETNRDEALNLMEKCKFDKTDKYIAISEYKEYQELKAILERGKE